MFPTFISILDIQSWWEVPSIAHFCSLFRTAFNLLDFDIEDLEEALLTDGTEENSWLQELIVRLVSGCLPSNEISTFNYQMFLRRLFRQKCQEHDRYNPFNTDCDFTLLPLRTKVDILHALCDFRLDAEDVLDQLKNLEADSLRVEPLGYDQNDSAYWYFYGTRLYREDFQKKNNKKKAVWQVICFTEDDWFQLTKKFKSSSAKNERALYHTLSKNFLPELPRLFKEKERQARRRLLENQPRRTSDRIRKLDGEVTEREERPEEKRLSEDQDQLKQEHQRKKEQDNRRKESLEKRCKLKEASEEEESSQSESESRHEMASKKKPRGRQRKVSTDSSSSKELSPSKRKKTRASDKHDEPAAPSKTTVGRQTNNSLSALDIVIIQQNAAHVTSNKKKLKTSQVFQQTDEDLLVGMHKILDFVQNHDDAWPFLDPVEEEYAPNYYSIIRRPMDLTRMEERLDQGYYKGFDKFKGDFQLIVNNCRLYNGAANEYTIMVDNLVKVFDKATERFLDQLSSSDEEIAVENLDSEEEEEEEEQVVEEVKPPKTAKRKKRSEEESPPKAATTRGRKPALAAQGKKRERSPSEESDASLEEEEEEYIEPKPKKSKKQEKESKKEEKQSKKPEKETKRQEKETKKQGKELKKHEKETKKQDKETKDSKKSDKEAKKLEKESKRSEKESTKPKKQSKKLEKDSKKSEKELKKDNKNAEKELKKESKNVEKESKKSGKDSKNAEKESKTAEKVSKNAEKESKNSEKESKKMEEKEPKKHGKVSSKSKKENKLESKKEKENKVKDKVKKPKKRGRKKKKASPSPVRKRSLSRSPSSRSPSPSPPRSLLSTPPPSSPEDVHEDRLGSVMLEADPFLKNDPPFNDSTARPKRGSFPWEVPHDTEEPPPSSPPPSPEKLLVEDKKKEVVDEGTGLALFKPGKDKHNKLRETIEKLKAKSEICRLQTPVYEFKVDDHLKENKDKNKKNEDKLHQKPNKDKTTHQNKTKKNHHHQELVVGDHGSGGAAAAAGGGGGNNNAPSQSDAPKKPSKKKDHHHGSKEKDHHHHHVAKATDAPPSAAATPPKQPVAKPPNYDDDALSLATEQMLKDINKWLDDTPKLADFSSASNSPLYLPLDDFDLLGEPRPMEPKRVEKPIVPAAIGVPSPVPAAPKKEGVAAPKDTKKKTFRDSSKFFNKRREVQRTIDRLQPGKSKGNLIPNPQNATKTNDDMFPLGPLSKMKDTKNSLIVKTDTNAPKLSLGSVLGSFGKHKFAVDDQKKEGEEDAEGQGKKEDEEDDKKEMMVIDESRLVEEEKKNVISSSSVGEEVKKEEVNKEEVKEKKVVEGEAKVEKDVKETKPVEETSPGGPTPNLSAWFKAFGAPKAPAPQKKPDKADAAKEEELPAVAAAAGAKSERVPLCDPSPSLESPQAAVPRQRRISTGSSMSERSSFSQDLDSPRVGMEERGAYPAPYPSPLQGSPSSGASPVMASPRPDISPRSPYPFNGGQMRVGFYQDTVASSSKSSPDKSCSPREIPPNSPYNQPPPAGSAAEHVYAPNTTHSSYSASYTGNSPYYTHAAPNYSSTNPTPPYNLDGSINVYYDTSKIVDQYQAKPSQNYTANSPASSQASPAAQPQLSPHSPIVHHPQTSPSIHSPSIHSPSVQSPSMHSPSLHSPSMHSPSMHSSQHSHSPQLPSPGQSLHSPGLSVVSPHQVNSPGLQQQHSPMALNSPSMAVNSPINPASVETFHAPQDETSNGNSNGAVTALVPDTKEEQLQQVNLQQQVNHQQSVFPVKKRAFLDTDLTQFAALEEEIVARNLQMGHQLSLSANPRVPEPETQSTSQAHAQHHLQQQQEQLHQQQLQKQQMQETQEKLLQKHQEQLQKQQMQEAQEQLLQKHQQQMQKQQMQEAQEQLLQKHQQLQKQQMQEAQEQLMQQQLQKQHLHEAEQMIQKHQQHLQKQQQQQLQEAQEQMLQKHQQQQLHKQQLQETQEQILQQAQAHMQQQQKNQQLLQQQKNQQILQQQQQQKTQQMLQEQQKSQQLLQEQQQKQQQQQQQQLHQQQLLQQEQKKQQQLLQEQKQHQLLQEQKQQQQLLQQQKNLQLLQQQAMAVFGKATSASPSDQSLRTPSPPTLGQQHASVSAQQHSQRSQPQVAAHSGSESSSSSIRSMSYPVSTPSQSNHPYNAANFGNRDAYPLNAVSAARALQSPHQQKLDMSKFTNMGYSGPEVNFTRALQQQYSRPELSYARTTVQSAISQASQLLNSQALTTSSQPSASSSSSLPGYQKSTTNQQQAHSATYQAAGRSVDSLAERLAAQQEATNYKDSRSSYNSTPMDLEQALGLTRNMVDRYSNEQRMMAGLQSASNPYYTDKGLGTSQMFSKQIFSQGNIAAMGYGQQQQQQQQQSMQQQTQPAAAQSLYGRQMAAELQSQELKSGVQPGQAAVPERKQRKKKSAKGTSADNSSSMTTAAAASPSQVTPSQSVASQQHGFQSYAGLKGSPATSGAAASLDPAAIALKSSSVPGSAFNFGSGALGMGSGLSESYPNLLDEFRGTSNYFMGGANAKPGQSSQGFPPFLNPAAHQGRSAAYPLGGPFMDTSSQLYQHYLQTGVLNHGLLGAAAASGYPPGYHAAALAMRQPYDSMTRPSWL